MNEHQLFKDAQQFGESNSQYAYRILYYNIMHLKMAPGDVLSEPFLTDFFGFSRTPIREAMFRLREECLIEVLPKNKTIVSYINADLVREGFLIRISLETTAVQELCEHFPQEYRGQIEENLKIQQLLSEDESLEEHFYEYDNAFHSLLFEAANMGWSYETMKRACTHFDRARFVGMTDTSVSLPQRRSCRVIYMDHEAIYRDILENRPEHSKELIQDHLNKKLLAEWKNPSESLKKYIYNTAAS